MVMMITAPMLIRLSENIGLYTLARLLSFVGYTWLGLLFLWVCSTVILDVYRLGLFAVDKILDKNLSFMALSNKSYFLIACVAVVMIGIYGGFEARSIRTSKIVLTTSKLPVNASPLKIIQVSDIHLGLIVGQDRLRRILHHVINAKPDIVVSTGDLVDGQMNGMEDVAQILNEIKPTYGKFAITGNHEFYAGLDQALDFTRKAGFRILRDEAVSIPGLINIVGIDDPTNRGTGSSAKEERKLLSNQSKAFTLLLKHRPDVEKGNLGLFDLQLSGHVHYGQIFPFRLITRIVYPRIGGLYYLPNNSILYVNRGTGTWGPPIRFLSPPEVTIIEIAAQSSR
jgi:predicted MPP superfamily phosphohydrolase